MKRQTITINNTEYTVLNNRKVTRRSKMALHLVLTVCTMGLWLLCMLGYVLFGGIIQDYIHIGRSDD